VWISSATATARSRYKRWPRMHANKALDSLPVLASVPEAFAACKGFVGRAPWPAADPPVGLVGHEESRTKEEPDQGVRRGRGRPPHIWLRLCHPPAPHRTLIAALCTAMLAFGAGAARLSEA